MTHYVCTGGCGENSSVGGTCNNNNCIKYHQPLSVCHCEDGRHEEAFQNPNMIAEGQEQAKA